MPHCGIGRSAAGWDPSHWDHGPVIGHGPPLRAARPGTGTGLAAAFRAGLWRPAAAGIAARPSGLGHEFDLICS